MPGSVSPLSPRATTNRALHHQPGCSGIPWGGWWEWPLLGWWGGFNSSFPHPLGALRWIFPLTNPLGFRDFGPKGFLGRWVVDFCPFFAWKWMRGFRGALGSHCRPRPDPSLAMGGGPGEGTLWGHPRDTLGRHWGHPGDTPGCRARSSRQRAPVAQPGWGGQRKRDPKNRLGRPKHHPRYPKTSWDIPKTTRDAPKTAWDISKPPGRPQYPPGMSQKSPGTSPKSPGRPQNPLRTSQKSSKTPQKPPGTSQNRAIPVPQGSV